MSIRVGRWDCFVCGKKGNLGPETTCGNCGASRPKDVVFYLPTDAQVVEEEQQLAEARAGADWSCSYCATQNKATATMCSNCGNDRAEAEDKDLNTFEYSLDDVPMAGARGFDRPGQAPPPSPPKRNKLWSRLLLIAGVIGAIVLLYGINRSIEVPIVDMSWERQIGLEEYKEVQEEDWSTPAGATNVESFRAVHHYDQVLERYETRTRTVQKQVGTRQVACGQRDLGNGYFETKYCDEPIYENVQETYEEPIYRQVPIYQTKYRYNVFKWTDAQPMVASAHDNKPHWPTLDSRIAADPDRFREGERSEVYQITIEQPNGKTKSYEVGSTATFEGLSIGQRLKAKKSLIFGTFKGLTEKLD